MLPPVFGVLFDGLQYAMLLFLLAVGLSVVLGMMNFINLAHGTFRHVRRFHHHDPDEGLGWPFLATLPMRLHPGRARQRGPRTLLYRRMYRAKELDQCC